MFRSADHLILDAIDKQSSCSYAHFCALLSNARERNAQVCSITHVVEANQGQFLGHTYLTSLGRLEKSQGERIVDGKNGAGAIWPVEKLVIHSGLNGWIWEIPIDEGFVIVLMIFAQCLTIPFPAVTHRSSRQAPSCGIGK